MKWFKAARRNSALLRFMPMVLLVAGVTAWQGCSTAGVVAGDSTYADSPYILADDSTLASQVQVASVDHEMIGGLMRALVTLKSNRNRTLWIQYRFSWYDANGVELDPGSTPYRDLQLQGRDAVSVTSMAPNEQAREFKIRIRKVKSFKLENVR